MTLPAHYHTLIKDLKEQIFNARIRAGLAVNRELIHLYWNIGRTLLTRIEKEQWGSKIIEQVAIDLKLEFPEIKGLSVTNLKYMRMFAKEYDFLEISQQAVDQIPWGHHVALFRIHNKTERLWYIRKTIENGWSRNILQHQIETSLYQRQGKALTNFKDTLPSPQSDLAHELLKNPYNLEFITITDYPKEREIEAALVNKLKDFLLELGNGFAFVGQQYRLRVEDEDYFIDMLFYHIKLKAYVVFELKNGKFRPEYAGKMNFYLNVIDDLIKEDNDNASIGIILYQGEQKLSINYALKGLRNPIGVSDYTYTSDLPKELAGCLPSSEDLSRIVKDEDLRNEDLAA